MTSSRGRCRWPSYLFDFANGSTLDAPPKEVEPFVDVADPSSWLRVKGAKPYRLLLPSRNLTP